MAIDPITNLASVTVSTTYDAVATSIVLSGGEGAKLPDPDADGNYNGTWYNFTDYPDVVSDPNVEFVRFTGPAGTGDTKTIVRGQEGISASTKNTAGKTYKIVLGFSKLTYDIIKAAVLKVDGIEANADVTDAVNIASSIHGVSGKTPPIDADELGLVDSNASNALKVLTWANLKATLKTYNDTLYALVPGEDDNYVTDAEKTVIGNTSGTNTGDQTLRTDATLPFTDNETNNSSTSKHGYLKKLSNVSTEYMSGTGVFSTPVGGTTITAQSFSTNEAHLTTDQDAGKAFTIGSFPTHAQIKKIRVRADFTSGQQSNTGTALVNNGSGILPAGTSIVYDGDSPTDLFASGDQILIDSEWIDVTAVDTGTNTLTVTRGIKGTVAAFHDDNSVITKGNHGVRLVLFKDSNKLWSERVIELSTMMTYSGTTDALISSNDDYFGLTADIQNVGSGDFVVIEDGTDEVCKVQNVNHDTGSATYDFTIFVKDGLAAHDTTKEVNKLIVYDLDTPYASGAGTLYGTVYIDEKIASTVNVTVEIDTDSYT